MTAPATPLAQSTRKGRREVKNALATAFTLVSFLIALVPLLFIVVYVFQRGSEVMSWSFLTEDLPFSNRRPGGGIYPAIVGTLVITGAAAAMALPLGVLGGIYLNEYGGNGFLARVVRFLAEVMTGVPSIVMGLFIYTIWVLPRKQDGISGFAGALALGALMLPIVIRTTEEILKTVPDDLREGSYALGCRKARTIRTVVMPHAAPGVVSGALLAVARAAGETAPLIFVSSLYSTSVSTNPFGQLALPNIPVYIFKASEEADPYGFARAWGAAFVLLSFILLANIGARALGRSRLSSQR